MRGRKTSLRVIPTSEHRNEVARRPRWTTTQVGLARRYREIPAAAEIGERQGTTEKLLRFEILKISGIRYCSFRVPLQWGSLVAWVGKPQVLSHVAVTTC